MKRFLLFLFLLTLRASAQSLTDSQIGKVDFEQRLGAILPLDRETRFLRELFGFSVWLTLGQIVSTLSLKLDQLLIGGVLGQAARSFADEVVGGQFPSEEYSYR